MSKIFEDWDLQVGKIYAYIRMSKGKRVVLLLMLDAEA